MHFNIFNKKDEDDASFSGKMKPASVKTKFSIIGGNTPSLTDNSFRGEQKRAIVLEEQLRQVSFTASKAYDKLDEVKLQNEMLEDQVVQQKQLLETFTQQLEQAKRETLELKRFHETELKQKLSESSKESSTISKLQHEKDMLFRENEGLRSEIEKLKAMYNEEANIMSKKLADNLKLSEEKENQSKQPENLQANQYREIIASLKQRIKELEESIETKNESYENNIMSLRNTMNLLNHNQTFLSQNGSKHISMMEFDEENILDKGDGSTYILENISFMK